MSHHDSIKSNDCLGQHWLCRSPVETDRCDRRGQRNREGAACLCAAKVSVITRTSHSDARGETRVITLMCQEQAEPDLIDLSSPGRAAPAAARRQGRAGVRGATLGCRPHRSVTVYPLCGTVNCHGHPPAAQQNVGGGRGRGGGPARAPGRTVARARRGRAAPVSGRRRGRRARTVASVGSRRYKRL